MHFAVGQVDSKPHLPYGQVKWKQWETSFNKVIIYMYTVKCMCTCTVRDQNYCFNFNIKDAEYTFDTTYMYGKIV